MALHGLLTLGIRAALATHRRELDAFARAAGMPRDAGAHLALTLEAMPGLLVALDRAVADADAPTKVLWLRVVSYLLLDDDHIPSREGGPIVGVLDDCYLVHRVAEHLLPRISAHTKIDPRSVSGGAQLLRLVLPPRVVRALDDEVHRVTSAPLAS